MKMGFLGWLSFILLVVGGLNWGLVGAFQYNLVTSIFGDGMLSNIVFDLVGLAAIWAIIEMLMKKGGQQQM